MCHWILSSWLCWKLYPHQTSEPFSSTQFQFALYDVFYVLFYFYHVSFSLLHHLFPFISAAFTLPSRDALGLGNRIVSYLPRCADTNSEVRKISAQVSSEKKNSDSFSEDHMLATQLLSDDQV